MTLFYVEVDGMDCDSLYDELYDEFVIKTCRYCNKTNLSWRKQNNRWLLFDGNDMHKCPINPIKL